MITTLPLGSSMRTSQQEHRGRTTCPRHGCGGPIEDRVLPGGRLASRCPQCDRARRGLCRDCPAPVEGMVGRALRCLACRQRRLVQKATRYEARHHQRRLAKAKRRYRQLPAERRARRCAYMAEWRRQNPVKVLNQKRRARLTMTPQQAARKREREHQRTTYFGKAPTCRRCGDAVPYAGIGRPRMACLTCRPARAA